MTAPVPDPAPCGPPGPPALPRVPARAHLVAVAGVVLLGLAAYANSYRGAFVFDDVEQLRENVWIRDVRNYLPGGAGFASLPNRFVAYLSFAASYRWSGLDVRGWHAVNVAIHLATAALVYALVVLTLRAPRLARSALAPHARAVAFLAAALFVTHPIQTQAVTYLVQRVTSLSALFYVAAVVAWARFRLGAPGRRQAAGAAWYALALACTLLAMKTKEIAFTLPFAILLWDLSFVGPAEPSPGSPRRGRLALLLPVLATALVIPLALVLSSRAPAGGLASATAAATRVQTELGRVDYLTTEVAVVVTYLSLILFPVGQNLDHDYPVYRSLLAPEVASALAVLLALAALAAWLYARTSARAARPLDPAARLAGFGIAWWFLALSVESGLIPIVDVIYEHRVYLPSVGLFSAAAVGAVFLARRLAGADVAGRAATLAGLALALLLATATLLRNQVWASELSVWSDAVQKSPGKARPTLNLGTALVEARRFREAIPRLERAVELDPTSSMAAAQLGAALAQVGRRDDAERALRAALRLAPDDPEATFNLAMLLRGAGRADEARPLFERFARTAPASYGSARRFAAEQAR